MDILSESTCDRNSLYLEHESSSNIKYPRISFYYLHTLTDDQAEAIMKFEKPYSWMMRENPYVITIRTEDGYIHHSNINLQLFTRPEVVEYDENYNTSNIYSTVSVYLDKLVSIYGLQKDRQVILNTKEWFQKRQGAA